MIIHETQLRQIAKHALKAKPRRSRRVHVDGKRMVGRPALHFPALTFAHAHRSYYDDVVSYLEAWEVRLLNDCHKAGFDSPTQDQLAKLFEEHIREHVIPGARFGLREQDISKLADKRAWRALKRWSPAYIDRMTEIGRQGVLKSWEPGRRESRGRRTTDPELIERLRALDGMGATQAAAELGISRQHVYRLRDQIKAADVEADRLAFQAELDELLPLPVVESQARDVSEDMSTQTYEDVSGIDDDPDYEPPAVQRTFDAEFLAIIADHYRRNPAPREDAFEWRRDYEHSEPNW